MKTELQVLAPLMLMAFVSALTAQDAGREKGASVPPAVLPETITAKVVDVLDGDTLRVANAQISVVTVRLDSIDSPEMAQPFGPEAKKRLAQLVSGRQVLVKWKEKDKYGRLLGIVYLGNAIINRQLVDEGYAWNFVKYSKSAALAKAEQSARTAKAGLWADERPIAPWDWRDGVRPEPLKPSTVASTNAPATTTAAAAAVVPEPPVREQVETTVYITRTGTHYHRDGCQHLRKSSIPMPLSRAVSAYTPCSKCRPPE